MDSATRFIEKLLDYTMNALGRQLGYMISYRSNIEELRYRLHYLIHKQEAMQHSIDEATRNGVRIEVQVESWMIGVEEIKTQVEQFFNEAGQSQTRCSRTSCAKLYSRYQLSRRAKKMVLEVENLARGLYLPSPKCRHSIDEIIDQIMEALLNPNVNMIGLCGLRGIGKTTIAKEVAKKVENQKMFGKAIMAVVSEDMNIGNIQSQIAEMLGMQLNEETTDARSSRLCERLKKEKKMLLILDDLWEELDLGKVGIPFVGDVNDNKKNEGFKLLLTSRNETLLSDLMKCEKIITVGVLSEDEAQELFKRIVELSIESSNPDLISIAIEIVRKCGGLPLAIVTAAKALRNKDMNIWEDALARLRNPLRRNTTGIKEVDSIMKLSYDQLSSENKKIFLLAAMLSHDPLIKDLLMYSTGLDFLGHIENMENAQAGIFAIVSKLKSLNLLLDSFASHRFTMHDVIRDFALSVAPSELNAFIVKHTKLNAWPDENVQEGYRGIFLEKSDIGDLPKELLAPRLEFFLLNSKYRDLAISDTFFKSTKELKLLSFINVCFSSLPFLNSLKKLKTLCLHSCLLEDMTQVGSLKQLTTLSLAYSEIEQLPFELAMLTSLQMLNLAHCSKLKVIPPKLLSSWEKLEVLSMENSFIQWEAKGSSEGNENASLDELKDLPISSLDIHIPDPSILPQNLFLDMNLKRYRIIIGETWRWYCNYETSKTLKLVLKSNIHLKCGVRKLLEGVEDLYLCGSNGLGSVLYNRFPYVRHLHIKSNDDIEYVVLSSTHHEVVLPMLETLKLQQLNVLKKLCQGPITYTLFQNLKVIKVSHCQQLKWIFSASMVRSFSQLVEIKIKDCDSMKEVVTSAIEDSSDQLKSANDVIVFGKLRTLKMERLPALVDFCIKDRAANNHCNTTSKSLFNNKAFLLGLKHLKLFNASNIRYLVMWNNQLDELVHLQNLETMEIAGCNNLHSLFDIFDTGANNGGELLAELRQLCLRNLDSFTSITSKDNLGKILNFKMLNHLTVCGCKQLKYLLPLYVLQNLEQLRHINVSDCEKLKRVFGKDEDTQMMEYSNESQLTKLHSLELNNLPELASICAGAHGITCSSLKLMIVEKCPNLTLNFANRSVNIKEQDPSEERSKNMIILIPSVLEKLHLGQVNHLKMMYNDHAIGFWHLTVLKLYECNDGDYIFSLSMAKNLYCLTTLEIISCMRIKQIVKREKGEAAIPIEFPEVTTLILEKLPNFTGSCEHGSSVKWLSLKTVAITGCPKIQDAMLGVIDGPLLNSVDVIDCKPWEKENQESNVFYLFLVRDELSKLKNVTIKDSEQLKKYMDKGSSFENLETLVARQCDNKLNEFLSRLLPRSHKLQELTVEYCSELEQVFDLTSFAADEQGSLKFLNLKTMKLSGLPGLTCMWNKDPSGILELGNLGVLEITKCGLRKGVLSTTVLKELGLLMELKIDSCDKIKHVVEEDCEMQERSFSNLKIIELVNLRKLIKFSSGDFSFRFPKLQRLTIKECPSLNTFTAGFLSNQTLTIEGTSNAVQWDKSKDNALPNLQTLKLVGLKNFDEIWRGWVSTMPVCELKEVEVDSLSSLRHIFPSRMVPRLEKLEKLAVKSCGSLHGLLLPASCPKLQEIDISGCNNLKEIFNGTDEEKPEKAFEFPKLQKLRIANCPALKTFSRNVSSRPQNLNMHPELLLMGMKIPVELRELELSDSTMQLWKQEPETSLFQIKLIGCCSIQELFSISTMQLWKQEPETPLFQNLTSLKLIGCCSIQKLFSISAAKHLSLLRFLKLYGCENMVQVLQGGGGNDKLKVFPELETLVLKRLKNLTSFCEQDFDFVEFPKLKEVRVEHVPKMHTFVKRRLKTPELKQVYVTRITKFWKGDLNKTIKHLHQEQGKLKDKVWESDQISPRHHTETTAESSSQACTK